METVKENSFKTSWYTRPPVCSCKSTTLKWLSARMRCRWVAGCQLQRCSRPAFKKATIPAPIIPHNFCSPELLAHILYPKHSLTVPLANPSKDFKIMGANLSTAPSPTGWPMRRKIRSHLRLREGRAFSLLGDPCGRDSSSGPKRAKPQGQDRIADVILLCRQISATRQHSVWLYAYLKRDRAKKFLWDYSRNLVWNRFDAYNKLTNAIRCWWWVHARCKFVDALPLDSTSVESSAAAYALEYCNKIFILDRIFEGHCKGNRMLTPEERHLNRQKYIRTILDAFFAWPSEITLPATPN